MTNEQVYSAWAPDSGIWSVWAKPVLFAHIGNVGELADPLDLTLPSLDWTDEADGQTGVVVDLPGAQSVLAGVTLAMIGFRPVPLFNAIPGPGIEMWGSATVDVKPIVIALEREAPELAALNLPIDAPPAFLLDASRRTGLRTPSPGEFDNRSISLPTDFPLANLLLSRGITRMVVVQPTGLMPQVDLVHTLLRWHKAGVQILAKPLDDPNGPEQAIIRRPSGFGMLWYKFLAMMGLRRSPLGGFGGRLPIASGG